MSSLRLVCFLNIKFYQGLGWSVTGFRLLLFTVLWANTRIVFSPLLDGVSWLLLFGHFLDSGWVG